MNTYKEPVRALRNFGVLTLFFFAVVVLGSVIAGSFFARHAIIDIDTSVRDSLPHTVIITEDFVEIDAYYLRTGQSWPEIEPLHLDALHEIARLPYIRNYDIFTQASMLSKDLEWVSFIQNEQYQWLPPVGEWQPFLPKGISSTTIFDIEEGLIEIVSGRIFTEDEIDNPIYSALISEDFAELNNLDIGSSFSLETILWDKRDLYYPPDDFYIESNIFSQKSYEFEVIGIFNPLHQIETGDEWDDARHLESFANRIYVLDSVIAEITIYENEQWMLMESVEYMCKDFMLTSPFYMHVYTLNDMDDIADFRVAAQAIIPDFWVVMQAGEGYNFGSNCLKGFTSSIQAAKNLSMTILLCSIAATLLILSFILAYLAYLNRKDICVYLTLGGSRSKAIAQTATGVAVLALVALAISVPAGSALSELILEHILTSGSVATQQSMDDVLPLNPLSHRGLDGYVPTTTEVLATYSMSLDLMDMGLFFALGIVTVLAATILPVFYIAGLNPKKIIM